MEFMTGYRQQSLSDIAEEYVKKQILSGNLKSGDKIVEADLSDSLEISRAPVREALRSLNEQGLLTFSPRRGHFVLEMPRDEIFEVFQIRISLELQVMRILVTNRLLAPQDFSQLMQMVRQMENGRLIAQDQSETVYLLNSLDLAFHKHLWSVAKSPRRAQLLENLFYQLLIVMNQNVESLGSCKEKAEEHLLMVEALQSNDVQKVCAEFQNHLRKYILAALVSLTDDERRTLSFLFDA